MTTVPSVGAVTVDDLRLDGPVVVSVVTPVLRPDARLLEAASSLRKQASELPWEWVVVAQEDTDGVAAAAARLLPEHPVRIVSLPRALGAPVARNLGVQLARGSWICPLDGDDELPSGALAALAPAVDRPEPAWCVGDGETFGEGLPTVRWGVPLEPGLVPAGELPRLTRREGHLPGIPVAGLYRRDALLAVGGWPALITDEDAFVKLALSSRWPGWYVPAVTYRYRRGRPGQLTELSEGHGLRRLARESVVAHLRSLGAGDGDWAAYVSSTPR